MAKKQDRYSHGSHGCDTATMEPPPDTEYAQRQEDPGPSAEQLPAEPLDQPTAPQPLAVAGVTPTALVAPATPATHFFGPIVSGNPGLRQGGYVLLVKRFDFDVSKGPVPASTEVDLPPNSLPLDYRIWCNVSPDGTGYAINLGLHPGSSELLNNGVVSGMMNQAWTGIFVQNPPVPTKFYLNIAPNSTTPTVGKFSVLISYIRN